MTVTVAQLGARVVRKLGIAIVDPALRPTPAAIISQGDIASRALWAVGVNPVPGTGATDTSVVSATSVAQFALRDLGVNPADLGSYTSGPTFTWNQIATQALIKLAVYAPDETPTALDQADAAMHTLAVNDQMMALDYVNWPATAIPSRVLEPYLIMACNLIAPGHGKPANMDAFVAAQEMVRQQALIGPIAQMRAETRVGTVHGELAAQGLAHWGVGGIPIWASDCYVTLVAQTLAPMYGKPVDAEARATALARLRRSVLSGPNGQAIALNAVIEAHESLNAMGVLTWPISAIPAGQADAYVQLTAAILAPTYGYQQDAASRQADRAAADAAKVSIRQASIAAGAPALAEAKVRAVQWSLEARGRARWTLFDIPRFAEEPIVAMAATLMGPECGVKPDPNWTPMAEMELMRIVSLPSNRDPVQATYF